MVKVRHGLVHVTLDVPHDARLLAWGTTAHQPLTGHVTFSEPAAAPPAKPLPGRRASAWAEVCIVR